MAYSTKDQLMLQEAYQGILFERVLPTLTLEQVRDRLEFMNESELDTTDEVIEEVWGGLKALGGAAGSALKGAGGAIGSAVKGAGGAIKQAATSAMDTGKRAAMGAGSAVASGAKQFGKNVSNMYQSGEQQAAASGRVDQTSKAIDNLIKILGELQQANPVIAQSLGDDFMNLSLSQIQQAIKRGLQSKDRKLRGAKQTGFTGGVGGAMQKGFQSGFQG
jgi:uncharacterized protein (DUF433 family)